MNTAVQTVIEAQGRLDVVVNNAGVMHCGVTEAFTVAQAREQLDVNVLGAFRTIKAVLPQMRKQGSGLLIQISSLAGRAVFPFFGLYCASKFAVEALAESLTYELQHVPVDSVIIEPGPFATDLEGWSPGPGGCRDRFHLLTKARLGKTTEELIEQLNITGSKQDNPWAARALVR